MKIHEIIKFGDVLQNDIPAPTLEFLKANARIEYQDKYDKEDLLNINNLIEDIDEGECERPADEIMADIEALSQLLSDNDCAYLRIVDR